MVEGSQPFGIYKARIGEFQAWQHLGTAPTQYISVATSLMRKMQPQSLERIHEQQQQEKTGGSGLNKASQVISDKVRTKRKKNGVK